MARAISGHQPAALPTRRFRRGLVLGVAALCVAFVAMSTHQFGWIARYGVLLFILLFAFNRELGRSTQGLARVSGHLLDERQIAVRDRAYRDAYQIMGVVFVVYLLATALSSGIGPSLAADLRGNVGVVVTSLELTFFLPTMILAWSEAGLPVDRVAGGRRRMRLTPAHFAGALVLGVSVACSLTVFLPVQTASTINPTPWASRAAHGGSPAVACSYFGASQKVGRGLVVGAQKLSAEICWNGKRVWQQWGLNRNDCAYTLATFTSVDARCQTRFSKDGAMHVIYRAAVSPSLLAFVHRDVTIHLWIRPNGRVVQFP